jgi:PqqD family protein of HPr-rel-A system
MANDQVQDRYVAKQLGTISRLSNELLIYDTETGSVHVLNSTARVIWESCHEPKTVGELVAILRSQFQVEDPRVISSDVQSILADFCGKGLIRHVPHASAKS